MQNTINNYIIFNIQKNSKYLSHIMMNNILKYNNIFSRYMSIIFKPKNVFIVVNFRFLNW